jgi:hypothetical protein
MDLYSDLFPNNSNSNSSINIEAERLKIELKNLQSQYNLIEQENQALKLQLTNSKADNDKLMKNYATAISNISKLFITARNEIKKKNEEIKLQREKYQQQITILNRNNNNNNNTYKRTRSDHDANSNSNYSNSISTNADNNNTYIMNDKSARNDNYERAAKLPKLQSHTAPNRIN